MAAKGNTITRTLRKAQSVIASYIRPGARLAEDSIEEVLRTLNETRLMLMRARKKSGGKNRSRPAAARSSARKRRVSTKMTGLRRSAAAVQRTVKRKSAARKK
jgi:hypothetical protein